MKGKLIKDHDNYHLVNNEQFIIGTTDKNILSCTDKQKLSLKNCQAIERGYDLDELADEYIIVKPKYREHEDNMRLSAFKAGFQKALELMEHRLSEETEWQVEVLMDICGDKVYEVPEPVLDEQGCLILKRIYN